MVSFVCPPHSVDKFFRSKKELQRQVTETAVRRSFSGRPYINTCCKLRNRGGFNLPPRVPASGAERRRAVELLGCCTQRKRMRNNTIAELKALIGAAPSDRLVAQQWKGAIQRDQRKANLQVDPNAFRHRNELLKELKLPNENATLSRCFILLDCLRRRYHANQIVNPRVINEITAALGSYPKSAKEAHHYIRTLAHMNRERRARERRPPRMPLDSIQDLQYASMLLGTYSVRGSVGAQTRTLEELLGGVPRNRIVARWWKKFVAAAIRKKQRRDRAARKRIEVEAKRFHRRLRRLERERKEALALAHSNGKPPSHGKLPSHTIGEQVLTPAEATEPAHQVAVPFHRAQSQFAEKASYFSRLYRFIGRFFILRR